MISVPNLLKLEKEHKYYTGCLYKSVAQVRESLKGYDQHGEIQQLEIIQQWASLIHSDAERLIRVSKALNEAENHEPGDYVDDGDWAAESMWEHRMLHGKDPE